MGRTTVGKREDQKEKNSHLESLPDIQTINFPNPKPPSLGWPRSLTPHPLQVSIQLRTRSSSPGATKS